MDNEQHREFPSGLRILIVDDHAMLRECLSRIVAKKYPEAVLGQAADASQALAQLEKHPWQVVLLDIFMPGRSGLDILKEIKLLQPETRIVVFSGHPEDHYALRVLKAGAAGYLNKEKASTEVIAAITKVMSGGRYVSANLTDTLVAALEKPVAIALHDTLSGREYQIMRMIAAGKSVKEISSDLKLSGKTISTYRTRLLVKLNLQSNAEIMRYALRENLIE